MLEIRVAASIVVPDAPEVVFALLTELLSGGRPWRGWYPVRALSVTPGLVGSRAEVHPRIASPWRYTVVYAEPPEAIRLRFHSRIYDGGAKWIVRAHGDGSRVTYAVDVRTSDPLRQRLTRLIPLRALRAWRVRRALRALRLTLDQRRRDGAPRQAAEEAASLDRHASSAAPRRRRVSG